MHQQLSNNINHTPHPFNAVNAHDFPRLPFGLKCTLYFLYANLFYSA